MTTSVAAICLQRGMWLVHADSRFNCRVVDVAGTRDGQVKVYTDYGHGGEPATQFFEATESVLVQMH